MQEILLTEDEAKLLQNDQSNKMSSSNCSLSLTIMMKFMKNLRKLPVQTAVLWLETSFMKDWKNTRVLIASRTESISRINPKGLFFEALEQENRTLHSHSFSEIALRPLNDTQITSYLRRYVVLEFFKAFDKDDEIQTISAINSWALVKEYERLIDQHGLKEIIRNPMLLMMSIAILRDEIIEDESKKLNQTEEIEAKQAQSGENRTARLMSSYKVYDLFLNKLIESSLQNSITPHDVQNEEQKGKPDLRYLAETVKQKLGNVALNLAGYSSYQQNESNLKELELSNLEFDLLHSIITNEHLDVNKTIARFVHRSMQDFLVANRIIEELTQSSITDGDSISETSKNMLMNQESLINGSLPFSIVHFIVDAVKDETISADTLL